MPKLTPDNKQTQNQLKARIERSGDIVGLHKLASDQTQAGISSVLNAGLIPELKGPAETALGRKMNPQALLAQSVYSNGLVEAVVAGADLLVSSQSQMLDEKEIIMARNEGNKRGKAISIIVEIDPTKENVKDQIKLAIESGADGIKFKPAGKEAAKTNEWIEYTKKVSPNLLLLVAGGVKESNRHTFSAKAGMGADTLDEIAALTKWAKNNAASLKLKLFDSKTKKVGETDKQFVARLGKQRAKLSKL